MGFDVRRDGKGRPRRGGLAAAADGGDKDVAGEDISLVESGACGAFVHGLEDEFEAVRHAAIGALHARAPARTTAAAHPAGPQPGRASAQNRWRPCR